MENMYVQNDATARSVQRFGWSHFEWTVLEVRKGYVAMDESVFIECFEIRLQNFLFSSLVVASYIAAYAWLISSRVT